ncbi:hypothetical protein R5R35_006646 [Gryllus longicercus]|uniref:C2H2-type domain-containing protein n=2 Tax=Gryllus longicercus TaxID=2509291 RepID=A0AAN9VS48_9ORTH
MSDKDSLVLPGMQLPDSVLIQNGQEENVPNSFNLEIVVNSSNSSQEPENNQCDSTDDIASHQVSEPGEKLIFFCVECKTAYKTAVSFEVHQQWHKVSRPYKCVKCEAMFQHAEALQAHLRWHGRPFVCGICKMTFKSAGSRKLHRKKHMQRLCKCSTCGDRFVNEIELQNHERKHTDYPYECDVCDALYMVRYYLKIHMRKHTSRRPWKCWECKALFVERTSLDVHKEDVHPESLSLI